MSVLVIAGVPECRRFAHAEYLADFLSQHLPNFRFHKIIKEETDWEDWLRKINRKNGWSHWQCPIVWKEPAMRGGSSVLVGGLSDMLEYCHEYYGVSTFLSEGEARLIIEGNLRNFERAKSQEKSWHRELLSISNQASAIVVGASEAGNILELLLAEIMEMYDIKKICLWEEEEGGEEFLRNVVQENWQLGPILTSCRGNNCLHFAFFVIILKLPGLEELPECDTTEETSDSDISKQFHRQLCNYARATFHLAEEIRKNSPPPYLRVIFAIPSLQCFCAAVFAEAMDGRINPHNVVAMTADADLKYKIPCSRWSLRPAVWGWPGIAELVDIEAIRVGAAWFEPATRALRKVSHSTLPQGKWHAELRPLCYAPEQLQELASPDSCLEDNKSDHNLQKGFSLVKMRELMNILNIWCTPNPGVSGEIISLGIFSDGTHDVPRGLLISQPSVLNNEGFWSPCDVVAPPLKGLQEILPKIIEATAYLGLGKCCDAVWTLPPDTLEKIKTEEKVQKEPSGPDGGFEDLYTKQLQEFEAKINSQLEKELVALEAQYSWVSVENMLLRHDKLKQEEALPEDEYIGSEEHSVEEEEEEL